MRRGQCWLSKSGVERERGECGSKSGAARGGARAACAAPTTRAACAAPTTRAACAAPTRPPQQRQEPALHLQHHPSRPSHAACAKGVMRSALALLGGVAAPPPPCAPRPAPAPPTHAAPVHLHRGREAE
eukprot:155506-Rhodomonas_salina.1